MNTRINELNEAELPARELLEKLGYTFVPRGVLDAERDSCRAVLLEDRLREALKRLNPWMNDDHVNRVIFNLQNVQATGISRNQAIHEYLTYGMSLEVEVASVRRPRTVQFFDFDLSAPRYGRNEYVVTTQMRIRLPQERDSRTEDDERQVIPDLVLFANGIPLVVIEAKAASLIGEVWKARAVRQLRRYQESRGAPELFDYNLACVGISGAAAAFGSFGAPEKAYAPWRLTPEAAADANQRYGIEPKGQAELLIGMLEPTVLLDIMRDFVVFEPENGRLVKKLPRYQQYRAVTGAMERMLGENDAEERGGVIWHTQGSGKSLTMLWLATKLRREPRLDNPTIVIVTDRTQLDRQISDTFRRCGFPSPERASRSTPKDGGGSSRRAKNDLQTLLRTGVGRTVMTTIQKFEEALETPSGTLDVLNPASNLVVIVDEAHRTQYGRLAAKMRQALPNAAFIGFTGTPIDKGLRSTMREFGPLIDQYDIRQSVADEATVPIYYEARLPELQIIGAESVDRLFERVFRDLPQEQRERIHRKFATADQIAESEQRIREIASDIADHYDKRFRQNGFKAQVVATSRIAAVRYAKWLSRFGVEAYPVITATGEDEAEITTALAGIPTQTEIESRFKDSTDQNVQMLVVVDMLLTGFDAPVEQVMYLDRNLREHSLLQAIARVNRPCTIEKPDGSESTKGYGLVVDYWGVSRNLEDALAAFDEIDARAALEPKPDDPSVVIESYAIRAEGHFTNRDLDDVWACAALFVPDEVTEGTYKRDLWDKFIADYRLFAQKIDEFLPDSRALPYIDRLAKLTRVREYVKAQMIREEDEIDWADVSSKVKELLDGRITATVREVMGRPVNILDQDFNERIAALPHDEARASMMEHAIRAQIKERMDENPAFYTSLADRLQKIIDAMRDQLLSAVEACKRLAELRDDALSLSDVAAQQGLTPMSLAVYELVEQARAMAEAELTPGPAMRESKSTYDPGFDPKLKDVALKVGAVMDWGRSIVDWQDNDEVQRQMRRDIKRELRNAGGLSEDQLNELVTSMIEIARRGSR